MALAAVAVATVVDLAFDPVHTHIPLCPFKFATGWWCPLCGGLRSAYSLAHGQVANALHDNCLFVLALPILFAYWVDWLIRGRMDLGRRPLGRVAVLVLVGLAIVFTALRNLPIGSALSPA